MEIKSNTTILDLNMDVLDIIFHNIYWNSDKLNFAKAHPHLSAAYVYHNPKKYKKIDFYELICDSTFILEWFGPYILSLRDRSYRYGCDDLTDQMVEVAAKYCPNVEVLEFLISRENEKIVEKNLVHLKKLNYIIVHISELSTMENIVKTLNQLQNLRRLKLHNSSSYLAPLNNLEHIEYLDLRYLEDDHIQVLDKLLKNLKTLKTEASAKTLNILSKYCEQLEYLKLMDYNADEKPMFPHFPTLKRLNIYVWDEYFDDGSYIKTLHGKYNNQLEILELPRSSIETAKTARRISKLKTVKTLCCHSLASRCFRYIARLPLEKLILVSLDHNDLFILLQECRTLRWLHLDRFKEMSEENLDSLFDILKANGFTPEHPFVLRVNDYRMFSCLNNKVALRSNGKLLATQWTSLGLHMKYSRKNSNPSSCDTLVP